VYGNRRFTYEGLGYRTVAEIQRNVVKRGERNAISRLLCAKNDKDRITTWKQDLNRILLVFNVRSAGSVWHLLTSFIQTELPTDSYPPISDIWHNAATGHRRVGGQYQPEVRLFYPSITKR
jgi:hypothetical protein